MALGLVGRKCGMTRVFTADGTSIPVSVIEVLPNRVVMLKTPATDGYEAVQVTVGERKTSHLTKAAIGHFAKNNVPAGEGLWEFRAPVSDLTVGTEIKVDLFQEGQMVDVTGTSRGKGFAGTIKRWNFTMGDATHGNSLSHRAPGSIGQRQSPGRVFKGKKMSGHMGNERVTVQSLSIVQIDTERNLLLISGAIPGAPNGTVLISPAVKAKRGGEQHAD